jgi:hypothetical protein
MECPAIKDVGKFYGHLVYFTAISYTLWQFDIFCGHLVHFSHFGKPYQEISGNPVPKAAKS